MKCKVSLLSIFCFLLINSLIAQQQVIRGKITDNQSQSELIGATVSLFKDSAVVSQTTTDMNGNYRLNPVPVGIYHLKVTYVSYVPVVIPKVVVNSAKEVILNIEMEEEIASMSEVTVTTDRREVSEWTSNSVKRFSVEETNRYAGSRSDPARMVSNYAGVLGADDSRNDIVIRGNSPLGMLWRLEGIDIPNPNHFAVIGNTGAPLSILNNKTLDNSEFYTGAFPAEIGNTVAGAFSLKMRNGNNEKYESTAQIGILGMEIASEGPLSKKKGGSYLLTYRYSTLKLFGALKIPIGTEAIPNYQDMALKLNFPLKKGGSVSFFSIGGLSHINTVVSTYKDPEKELYVLKDRDQYFGAGMGVAGVSFTKPINSSTFLKAIVATTLSGSYDEDRLVYRDSVFRVDSIVSKLGNRFKENRVSLNVYLNKKINTRFSIQTGFLLCRYYFNMIDSIRNQSTYAFDNQIDYKGEAYLMQPYVEGKYKLANSLVVTAGIHGQYFSLNGSHSIEPRGSLQWNFLPRQSLSVSAGMHSQMQPVYNYFYHFPGTSELHNKNIDFTRSNHFILSYDYFLTHSLRLKLETYYQYLYNVPVTVVPSAFSLINQGLRSRPFYPQKLVNKGTGKNYGVEFTLEKFFVKSFFFMYTCSIYDSKYKGSDGVERVTDFNRTYAMNFLVGKAIKFGDKKSLELGMKATTAGGRRYTPIDEAASKLTMDDIFIDSLQNTLRFKPYSRLDFKFAFKLNTRRLTHEIGVDLVNILNVKNVFSISYSSFSNTIIETYQLGFLPIFYYKVDF